MFPEFRPRSQASSVLKQNGIRSPPDLVHHARSMSDPKLAAGLEAHKGGCSSNAQPRGDLPSLQACRLRTPSILLTLLIHPPPQPPPPISRSPPTARRFSRSGDLPRCRPPGPSPGPGTVKTKKWDLPARYPTDTARRPCRPERSGGHRKQAQPARQEPADAAGRPCRPEGPTDAARRTCRPEGPSGHRKQAQLAR